MDVRASLKLYCRGFMFVSVCKIYVLMFICVQSLYDCLDTQQMSLMLYSTFYVFIITFMYCVTEINKSLSLFISRS